MEWAVSGVAAIIRRWRWLAPLIRSRGGVTPRGRRTRAAIIPGRRGRGRVASHADRRRAVAAGSGGRNDRAGDGADDDPGQDIPGMMMARRSAQGHGHGRSDGHGDGFCGQGCFHFESSGCFVFHPRKSPSEIKRLRVGTRNSRPARSAALNEPRALRSTAPENSPKTPENSLKSEFSTVWTNSFHCVEKRRKVFPLCGKIGQIFSILSVKNLIVRTAYILVLRRLQIERPSPPIHISVNVAGSGITPVAPAAIPMPGVDSYAHSWMTT